MDIKSSLDQLMDIRIHDALDKITKNIVSMRRVGTKNYYFVIYCTVNDDSRTITVIRIFYGGRNVTN